MTIPDSIGVYNAVEFIDNPEARCPIVLILDVSRSIEGHKFDTVNRALVKFRDIIREDPVTALRADVAVIAFPAQPERSRISPTNGTDFEPPRPQTERQTERRHELLQSHQSRPGHHRGPQAKLPGWRHRLLP